MAWRSVSALALVGAIGIIVISLAAALLAVRAAEDARRAARSELQAQADAAGNEATRFVGERLNTLTAIAASPGLRDGQMDSTQLVLDSLPGVASFLSLWVIHTDGRLVAQSGGVPSDPPETLDRDYVQEVLRTGQPSVGTVVLGRVIPEPLIPFGVPLRDVEGRLTGLLAAAVSANDEDALRFGLARSVVLLGRQARVVYDSEHISPPLDERSEWLSRTLPEGDADRVVYGTGIHGDAGSVIAFSQVALPHGEWTIVVESPASALYGEANARLQDELTAIGVFFLTTAFGLGLVTWQLWRQAVREAAAQRRAAAAVAARDEVVHHVLHDLRSPLTVITGVAALLARNAEPRDAPMVEGIQEAAARMEGMLSEISAAQGGTVVLRPAPVRLQLFLDGVVEAHRLVDDLHRFEVTFEGPTDLEGQWDPVLLGRVLDNLISNARKFSPPESTVAVRARVDGTDVLITVTDEGRGIPEQELSAVFEPFHRAGNSNGTEGLGIGLASVANIVRQHGGLVHAESTVGRGTTMSVRLPIERPAESAAEDERHGLPT